MRSSTFTFKFFIIFGTLAMQGCWLFSSTVEPREVDLARSSALSPVFRQDPKNWALYHSADGTSSLVGIKQCGEGLRFGSLARTRQLFVGFAGVKVEKQSELRVGEVTIERALVSAALDAVPVQALTYSFGGGGCAFDLVLWSNTSGQSAPKSTPTPNSIAATQQAFEGLLPQLIPDLTR